MAHTASAHMLEERIGEWRSYARRRQAIDARDVAELEDHLRSQVADLRVAGLNDEEASHRREAPRRTRHVVARVRPRALGRLWKRLVVADCEEGGSASTREALVALALAAAAAAAIKVPELFGLSFGGTETAQWFYARNVSLFVLPFLAVFFAWKRGLASAGWLGLAALFVAGVLAMNLMPFAHGDTRRCWRRCTFPWSFGSPWASLTRAAPGGATTTA